ncbi:MAG: hypothetical protein NTZ33_13795 [Bacteroidetes bacterium]|nr:hypothetical protein [Bacteroidota bacterium]
MKKLIILIVFLISGNLLFAQFGQIIGSGSATTKLLLHLNGNSRDTSGNNNNCTDVNITYSISTGKFAQGASMTTGYITKTNNNLAIDGGSCTLSLWIKRVNLIQSGKYGGLIDLNSNVSKVGYTIGVDNTAGVISIYFDRVKIGVADQSIAYTYNISTTNFDNLILTYNSISTTLSGYLNGMKIGERTASGTGVSGNSGITIGDYYGGGGTYKFNGYIDEVIIDNVAWNAEFVKKYYEYTKGLF